MNYNSNNCYIVEFCRKYKGKYSNKQQKNRKNSLFNKK